MEELIFRASERSILAKGVLFDVPFSQKQSLGPGRSLEKLRYRILES